MRLCAAVCLLIAGCSGPGIAVSSGTAGGGSSTGGRGTHSSGGGSAGGIGTTGGGNSTGGSSGTTGGNLCAGACETLTGAGCGVLSGWQGSCDSLCNASSAAIACLQASGSDCNSLALCYFQALCDSECGSGACLPGGSDSCDEALTCADACSGQPGSCACGCQAGLTPAKAASLLVASACAATDCTSPCSPSGTALSCDNCLQQHCNSQVAACVAN